MAIDLQALHIDRIVRNWSEECERMRNSSSGHTSAWNHKLSTTYKWENQVGYFVTKAFVLAVYGY